MKKDFIIAALVVIGVLGVVTFKHCHSSGTWYDIREEAPK